MNFNAAARIVSQVLLVLLWKEEAIAQSPAKEFVPISLDYRRAVRTAITNGWERKSSYSFRSICAVNISQQRGGMVIDATITQRCMLDGVEAGRLRSHIIGTRLPYEGFEDEFRADIVVDLRSWDLGMETPSRITTPVGIDAYSQTRYSPVKPQVVANQWGSATIEAIIDSDGEVLSGAAVKVIGSKEHGYHAVEMARHWTFIPERRVGKRVQSLHRFTVVFDGSPYVVALRRAIEAKLTRPLGSEDMGWCPIEVDQSPGGWVQGIRVLQSCSYRNDAKAAVVAAVTGASPLPYSGFESAFTPVVRLGIQLPPTADSR